MTSLLAKRRRAEEFARLLEERRRSHNPELAPLAELADALRPAQVEPDPSFRSSLREQLVAVAASSAPQAASTGTTTHPEQAAQAGAGVDGVDGSTDAAAARTDAAAARTGAGAGDSAGAGGAHGGAGSAGGDLPPPIDPAPARRRLRGRPGARAVAVVAALALAGGVATTAAASRGALPGETLYVVKRGLERTETAMSGGGESAGTKHLKQASTRLEEINRLTAGDDDSLDARQIRLVRTTLQEFTHEAKTGSAALLGAYHQRQRSEPLQRLREFTTGSLNELTQLAPVLPSAVDPPLDAATRLLVDVDDRAAQLCPSCDPTALGAGGLDDRAAGDVPMASGTQQESRTSTRSSAPSRGKSSDASQAPGAQRAGGPSPSGPRTQPEPTGQDPTTTPSSPPSPDQPTSETPSAPTPSLPLPTDPTDPETSQTPTLPSEPTPTGEDDDNDDDTVKIKIGDVIVRVPI